MRKRTTDGVRATQRGRDDEGIAIMRERKSREDGGHISGDRGGKTQGGVGRGCDRRGTGGASKEGCE